MITPQLQVAYEAGHELLPGDILICRGAYWDRDGAIGVSGSEKRAAGIRETCLRVHAYEAAIGRSAVGLSVLRHVLDAQRVIMNVVRRWPMALSLPSYAPLGTLRTTAMLSASGKRRKPSGMSARVKRAAAECATK